MRPTNILSLAIVFFCCKYTDGQVTLLEAFRPIYRWYRYSSFNFVGRTDNEWSYKWNLERGKVQKPIPESQPFFCDVNGPGRRSSTIPTSVHKLRPGDIDIIGAMGDSITAGNGALATNVLQLSIENKGVSGTIGGQSTWRKYLTLPNIIKEFNPNLYGYSLEDGFSTDRSSRFNTAEIAAVSLDMPHEAKVLIKRMTADPHVIINEHWKLISILIGPNDFCLNFCDTDKPEETVEKHSKNLVTTLRILRDNLPRTMVNLVTPPSLRVIIELRGKPFQCESIHRIECPCIFGSRYQSKLGRYLKIMDRWQEVLFDVANMTEFNTEDFTVNIQPFMSKARFPTLRNGKSDYTYVSLDCFHLSQKGYARAANALWNNMLEREGQKTSYWKEEFTDFKCPTKERPYIATKNNS